MYYGLLVCSLELEQAERTATQTHPLLVKPPLNSLNLGTL